MVFDQCSRTIKIVTSRQIWDQALTQKVFIWAKVGDVFLIGFELAAPLANNIFFALKK
jgi:hypothetical protein